MKKVCLLLTLATCLMGQLDNGLADALDKDIQDDAEHPPYNWSVEMNPEDHIDQMLFISFREHCLIIHDEG